MNVAIITGASSGMGRRMAIEIKKQIPNVQEYWLFGRRKDRLKALKKTLQNGSFSRVFLIKTTA